MLALFYREFCESPVKLLHREFLFVEFFGSFFPKQDMSEIYAKSWGADGKIYTRLYKPVLEDNDNNSLQTAEKTKFDLSDEATEVFMKRFDELEQKIEQLKSSQSQRKTPQSQRKDDAE